MENQNVFLIDVDEFIVVLCEHSLVGDFMADDRLAGSNCMRFSRIFFGTSYLPDRPANASVLTSYYMREIGPPHRRGKVAIRSPLKVARHSSYHHYCSRYKNHREARVPVEMARLNHYWLRGGMKAKDRRVTRGPAASGLPLHTPSGART